jgi:hypothetical protein
MAAVRRPKGRSGIRTVSAKASGELTGFLARLRWPRIIA